ncbi:NADPH:quinone reductase [Pseudonocardia dioxanivorans CB1190]|uniref:NADPH:quinone reductase n=1 Tax=Pseudonocardia dioxanivorans (strain ATCC 55486 / DSM 44775 / JCM 13855 / CB1190) TaxID=675635 RepID=F4CPR7_PSEUX|nr:NADPH:quinone oxidoreductase family protein [Pseudonocardia dioxanivorans]AEA26100.1 NADPH:quinone reductase [Pseudonocardia dioxanivorans CB1190]
MRSVQVVRLEGPSAVEVVDVAEPVAADGQVLVDVRAAGVNFPDVLLTRGLYQYRPDPPFGLGSELAGVVRAAPAGSGLAVGERVAAFSSYGAFSEVAAVAADHVVPLPDEVSFAAGACLPMNYLTAHFTLAVRGRLRAGDTVLVHGAAGGIGTAVTQLARAMDARVVAVVSSDAKADVARAAGAHETVLVDGFKDAARELTGGKGVDIVVDPVGGDRFTDSLRALAPFGRVLVVGFTAGEIPTVKVNRLLLGNTEVVGVAWGGYALSHEGYVHGQWADLLPHLRSGALSPVISQTFPLERAAEALATIDERRVTGKVVLQP